MRLTWRVARPSRQNREVKPGTDGTFPAGNTRAWLHNLFCRPSGADSDVWDLTRDLRPGLTYAAAPRLELGAWPSSLISLTPATQSAPRPFDFAQGRLLAQFAKGASRERSRQESGTPVQAASLLTLRTRRVGQPRISDDGAACLRCHPEVRVFCGAKDLCSPPGIT
jgi:hypothetical protein